MRVRARARRRLKTDQCFFSFFFSPFEFKCFFFHIRAVNNTVGINFFFNRFSIRRSVCFTRQDFTRRRRIMRVSTARRQVYVCAVYNIFILASQQQRRIFNAK